MNYYAGVDIGAITAKAAIISEDGDLVSHVVTPAGYKRATAAEEVLAQVLTEAGLSRDQVIKLGATGYGRVQVAGADRVVTEITCHARGAYRLFPDVGTVIDIGGQDSKGIAIGGDGKVVDFIMNDKCAAGTGRFLEVMARALEVDLDQFGELSLQARRRAKISSTCTVFAESEVITHIAAGVPRNEIVSGINESIAARVASMVKRIPVRDAVVLTGGVAKNIGVVQMLAEKIEHEVVVPELAQLAGAIGAAIVVLDG